MRTYYSSHFRKSFRHFPKEIQEKFRKQAKFLIADLRHPSLHAKKYDEAEGVWQARVDDSIRFYFLIKNDTYTLLDIRHHAD